jgi:hypothetical protein
MLRTLSRLFLSLLIGLALALAFDFIFLNLSGRPSLDQALLVLFSTASFSYLAFLVQEEWREFPALLRLNRISFDRAALHSFVREHAVGLLLAILFFPIYAFIGSKLNFAEIDTVDNFLDADNFSWMTRIAEPAGSTLEMRGPHPFAYLIFRPLGWILNLFTDSPAYSAILLNTLAGGLTVFLAWVFMKNATGNRVYALLIACLLGLSTSHLFFGSVIETYIFSAAALMLFLVLLQKQADSRGPLVTASLLTFGITVTNFAQNLIAFFVARPRIREIFRFMALTISVGVLLSLVHAAIYPSSQLFFLPSDTQGEADFQISVFNDPAWRAIGRVVLLLRTMLLYTVIAPIPYVFGQEVGGTFPRFNFFKIVPGTYSFSSYDGLGNVLVVAWAGLLLAAGFFFLWDLFRTRRPDLRAALVLCLLFNFILHLKYGYEPFLYSPDWAYALIFLVGLSLAPLANNRILQGGLLVFLLLLAYNQFQFFAFILQMIAPFIAQMQ